MTGQKDQIDNKNFQITDEEVIISGSVKEALDDGLKISDVATRQMRIKDTYVFGSGKFMSDINQNEINEIKDRYVEYTGVIYDKQNLSCLDAVKKGTLVFDHGTEFVGAKAGVVENIHSIDKGSEREWYGDKLYLPYAAQIVLSDIAEGKSIGISPAFNADLDYRDDGVYAVKTELVDFGDVRNPSNTKGLMNKLLVNNTYDHKSKMDEQPISETTLRKEVEKILNEKSREENILTKGDIPDIVKLAVKGVLNEKNEIDQEKLQATELDNLKSKIKELENKNKELADTLAIKTTEIEDLNNKLTAVKNERDDLKAIYDKEAEKINSENIEEILNYLTKNNMLINREAKKQELMSMTPSEVEKIGRTLGSIVTTEIQNSERKNELQEGDAGIKVNNSNVAKSSGFIDSLIAAGGRK
jgi:hypothetical protein